MKMLPLRTFAPLLALSLLVPPMFSQQTSDSAVTPCIEQGGARHCSELSVQQAVSAASSIAIETGPRDHIGEGQLRSFVEKLGKSLALDTQSADLALKLIPVEQSGVNYGAADRELARLDVFAPVGPARKQQLIWEETLSGPVDLTWPAVVARILDQFRHRVKAH